MTLSPRAAGTASVGERAALEMGQLLTGAVTAVVRAQEALDADAMQRTTDWLEADAGSPVPPPMWWSVSSVALELQTSVTTRRTEAGGSRLSLRTLDPRAVSLYGYEASAGLRMRLLVERQGPVVPKAPAPEAEQQHEDGDDT